jgi:Xaa-Pro aminopeptidase
MKQRVHSLQQQMSVDAMLIENPTDLLYLTGLSLSKGALLIGKKEATLFVDGRYLKIAEKEASVQVCLWEGKSLLNWCIAKRCKTLSFDSSWTSVEQFEAWKTYFQGVHLIPTARPCKQIRGIKDSEEIKALRKAADLTWAGLQHARTLLKEGISEQEIAFAFEHYVRTHGASELSFEPIIAFGEQSAYPHHRAGATRLKRNDLVLMDVGAVVNDYRGDLTRVHFFGTPDPKLAQMLEWTQKAHAAAIAKIKPGTFVEELDLAARAVFAKEGVEELFVHGLGHGIGLETHEFPSIKKSGPDLAVPLEPGMIFTIEPGLYKPGLGGVRWEDMVLVTPHGVARLYP